MQAQAARRLVAGVAASAAGTVAAECRSAKPTPDSLLVEPGAAPGEKDAPLAIYASELSSASALIRESLVVRSASAEDGTEWLLVEAPEEVDRLLSAAL